MTIQIFEVGTSLIENTVEKMGDNLTSMILVTTASILTLGYFSKYIYKQLQPVDKATKYPPYIPSSIPFLGHAIAFGKSPIEFLENAYDKYGPVFSFTMVGKTFTYLLGSDAATLMFNSKNEDLNAEDVYSRLTTPVFGKGVAYDVPNPIFLEQKKMLKTGLNIAHFKQHVKVIEEETRDYFKRWGDSGVKNLFEALAELIILTASSCLHGKEIRSMLDERVASSTQTWTVASVTRPGSSPAGCPSPASERETEHMWRSRTSLKELSRNGGPQDRLRMTFFRPSWMPPTRQASR
ncbi:hypothetical protein AGOR_G00206440 [Albula goreensis]|uniref:Uncharacterized protein n=1 Tax=Albula goreensis TaxID=1534307 RepID=A0A8T3CKS3_9TELE|nr:hypothetical protein AGOR_G00206440 [Albula goreensis]